MFLFYEKSIYESLPYFDPLIFFDLLLEFPNRLSHILGHNWTKKTHLVQIRPRQH